MLFEFNCNTLGLKTVPFIFIRICHHFAIHKVSMSGLVFNYLACFFFVFVFVFFCFYFLFIYFFFEHHSVDSIYKTAILESLCGSVLMQNLKCWHWREQYQRSVTQASIWLKNVHGVRVYWLCLKLLSNCLSKKLEGSQAWDALPWKLMWEAGLFVTIVMLQQRLSFWWSCVEGKLLYLRIVSEQTAQITIAVHLHKHVCGISLYKKFLCRKNCLPSLEMKQNLEVQ